jgi:hypothetical protein
VSRGLPHTYCIADIEDVPNGTQSFFLRQENHIHFLFNVYAHLRTAKLHTIENLLLQPAVYSNSRLIIFSQQQIKKLLTISFKFHSALVPRQKLHTVENPFLQSGVYMPAIY